MAFTFKESRGVQIVFAVELAFRDPGVSMPDCYQILQQITL